MFCLSVAIDREGTEGNKLCRRIMRSRTNRSVTSSVRTVEVHTARYLHGNSIVPSRSIMVKEPRIAVSDFTRINQPLGVANVSITTARVCMMPSWRR